MNRLWVRISLTFAMVVVFVIMLPLLVGLATQGFPVEELPEQITLTREEIRQIIGTFFIRSTWRFAVIVTVIGLIAGIITSRTLSAPLQNLADAARSIGGRHWDLELEEEGTDEIKAVARAFNEMTAELRRAEARRSNLLADVAHELRTPLTVLQGNLRAILDDVYELDKAEIARLYDQTRYLSRLVDDLRSLAQFEAKELPLNLTQVPVNQWINNTALFFQPTAQEKGIQLITTPLPTEIQIRGDRDRLSQAINNLVDNALRHTPSGGEISISAETTSAHVLIHVKDNGDGLAPEHLPHIFDRFYRADHARSRDTGGVGLGLAISRAIIREHTGDIKATSPGLDQGCIFTIKLPLENTE